MASKALVDSLINSNLRVAALPNNMVQSLQLLSNKESTHDSGFKERGIDITIVNSNSCISQNSKITFYHKSKTMSTIYIVTDEQIEEYSELRLEKQEYGAIENQFAIELPELTNFQVESIEAIDYMPLNKTINYLIALLNELNILTQEVSDQLLKLSFDPKQLIFWY